MSVDHFDCDACSRTRVYEEYIAHCEICGDRICDWCSGGHKNEDGEVEKEFCPNCKENMKNAHMVKEGNRFDTFYHGQEVMVEIIHVYDK